MSNERQEPRLAAHGQPSDAEQHARTVVAILEELEAAPDLPEKRLAAVLRRHPLPDGRVLSKGQLLKGYAELCETKGQTPDLELVRRLRVKAKFDGPRLTHLYAVESAATIQDESATLRVELQGMSLTCKLAAPLQDAVRQAHERLGGIAFRYLLN